MGVSGQAVVVDALFFMLICGSAAGILFWAGAVYGENSYNAYKYMYLNDYETSVLGIISGITYQEDIVELGVGAVGNERAWIDELGSFMNGDFDVNHKRYRRMVEEWTKFCIQTPTPISLEVFNEKEPETAVGNKSSHLFFGCPLSPDGADPKVYASQDPTATTVYFIEPISGVDGTTIDPVYDRIYPYDSRICDCEIEETDNGKKICIKREEPRDCSTDPDTDVLHFECSTEITCEYETEPPYFASNVQNKLCADLVCVMQTKVYY